jgi:Icc-related predicted phosphoesterase
MKALIIADDDEVSSLIKPCDVDLLISLGDLSDITILKTAKTVNARKIYAVKGNHDSGEVFSQPIVDLHRVIKISDGTAFGGFCGCWKYKPIGFHIFEQQDVFSLMSHMSAVDIFIAHNSPRGVHERDQHAHVGFDSFKDYINRYQPRLFLHGHQHVNSTMKIGKTEVLGVFGFRFVDL